MIFTKNPNLENTENFLVRWEWGKIGARVSEFFTINPNLKKKWEGEEGRWTDR